MKLGVLITTYKDEKALLVNLFNSLKDLEPYEICIADTSQEYDGYFNEWLYNEISLTGAHVGKVRYVKNSWEERQVEIKNDLIELSESDWMLMMDSDEMLTIESARDLKKKIMSLPPDAQCLRMKKINLIDDEHCLSNDLWNGRPPIGHHPQVFKKGAKFIGHPRYENKRHPILIYEGRDTISYNSEQHPCKDWNNYYMLHLWLYKDMPLKWHDEKWQRKQKDDKVNKGNSTEYLKQRGWNIRELPKIATWRKIII